jgi:hypothetical protein
MHSLQTASARALRGLLDSQPTTAGKVAFAWRMAAGPALARAGQIHWSADGVLRVDARDGTWRREIHAARPVIAERMNQLLGTNVVKRIVVRVPE